MILFCNGPGENMYLDSPKKSSLFSLVHVMIQYVITARFGWVHEPMNRIRLPARVKIYNPS